MSLALPVFFEERSKYVSSTKPRNRENTSYVNKRVSTIYIPAFSVESVWRGASEIIKEFRYSLSNNVSLLKITAPANPTFVACVAWKPTSETIVRYKLWQDAGEILYVPLYSGQKIDNDFSIEIWNVQPDESLAGGSIITEDGFQIETEDEGFTLVTEQATSLIGVTETITYGGTALLHLSRLILPTGYCESDNNNLTTYEECVDVTFFLGTGTYTTTYIPFDGDYYLVTGDCGVTTLVKGTRFSGTELILQSTDETWHRIYTMRFGGQTHLVVDQDNAAPSDTPYIYLFERPDVTYKIDLMFLAGNHHLRIDQNPATELDYTVLYLQADDGLYYGIRLYSYGGNIHIQVAQDNTVL